MWLIMLIWLCATPDAAKAAGDDYLRRGRRGLAGAGGGASRATTVASHARACGDVSQGSAASAMEATASASSPKPTVAGRRRGSGFRPSRYAGTNGLVDSASRS